MVAPDLSIAEKCDRIIATGSLSFSLASRIFDERRQRGAHLLYSWCRFADDSVDRADGGIERRRNLASLRQKTIAVFSGNCDSSEIEFLAFQQVVKEFNIPSAYALDLIDGMEMDVEGFAPQSFQDLERYAYCVAGTVGLMMSHIMGVSDSRALRHAVDLGIALQLTNIARDVGEDFRMGRIYFPADWLLDAGIPREKLLDLEYRPQLTALTARLLDMADRYYESGSSGLNYLSWRAAIAISAAKAIYSEIGGMVRARGEGAFESRAIVSSRRKVYLAVKAVVGELAKRIFNGPKGPWKSVEIKEIWRPV